MLHRVERLALRRVGLDTDAPERADQLVLDLPDALGELAAAVLLGRAQGEVEVFRDGKKVAQLGAGTSVGEMAYLAPSAELKKHSTDVIITEPTTTISFTPETLMQLSPNCRHLFHDSFIRVLVRRLHAAHEAIAHPRRIL